MLRLEGPATATQLAQQLKLNTGATSYHLRQLAEHGFIVEDTERGDARDRWWKAAHQSTRAGLTARSEDEAETTEAYLQTVALMYTETLMQAVSERRYLPRAWQEASTTSDWHLRLTPARAEQLVDAAGRAGRRVVGGGGRRRHPRRRHLRGQPQRVPEAGHGGPGRGRAVTGAARPALRLADRRGDLAPRHPGLDDRHPVAGAGHHRLGHADRTRRGRRAHPAGALQGDRRPARRPGRPSPDGDLGRPALDGRGRADPAAAQRRLRSPSRACCSSSRSAVRCAGRATRRSTR